MNRYVSWCLRALVLGALGLSGLWWFSAGPVPTASAVSTLTVNDNGDENDNVDTPGDGICNTLANKCTLRAAIEVANDTPGVDRIEFSHDFDIDVLCATSNGLPTVTRDGLTIDAQGHNIVIRPAASDCAGDSALEIEADNISLKGLKIPQNADSDSFGHAILVGFTGIRDHTLVTKSSASCVLGGTSDDIILLFNATNATVRDCFIGVGDDGEEDLGNDSDGIMMFQVSGATLIKDNTIGFIDDGVNTQITVSTSLDMTISGNNIGTNKADSADIGGTRDGLELDVLELGGTSHVTISSNQIQNFDRNGVTIRDSGAYRLENNRIDDNDGGGVVTGSGGAFNGSLLLYRSFFERNGGLGIDLDDDGVSCGGGGSEGSPPASNGGIVCPKITQTLADGTVSGTTDCLFNNICTVELYAVRNEANSDDGHGEGSTFLGSTNLLGNGSDRPWSIKTKSLNNIKFLTATVTYTGNGTTSEFAKNVKVNTNPALVDGVFIDGSGDPLGGLKGFGGDEVRDIKTKGKGGVNVSSGDGPTVAQGDSEEVPFRLQNIGGRADRIKLSSITSSRSLKGVSIIFDANPAGASPNDLLKVNDGTTQVAPDEQVDGVLTVGATSQAAPGKYVVILNFKANGSSSNDRGDSVTLKFKVTAPV